MLINIFGGKCIGIDAVPVTVEVDISNGIGIHLVGLGDTVISVCPISSFVSCLSEATRI